MSDNDKTTASTTSPSGSRWQQHRTAIIAAAVIAVVCVMLAIGRHNYNKSMQESITGDPAIIDKGEQYIAALTKDPSSVQFQGASEVHHCVTGKMNAKNSYGAYVGFHSFYYDDDRGVGQIDPGSMNDASGQFDLDAAKQSMGYSDGLLQCTAGHAGDPAYGQGNATAAQ